MGEPQHESPARSMDFQVEIVGHLSLDPGVQCGIGDHLPETGELKIGERPE